ncbi:MAG: hypothetical protein OEZ29_01430 [Candidatus Bathyarchaeota archaeon]|nr:hypothetical protein [Candidatus Bathyarchaeota archaeon]MDH5779238.1 hypothetical protein [Candidatus Bathyarchaeota archaeon]
MTTLNEKKEEGEEAEESGLSTLIGVEKELGFLILGIVFGAALGILGNLWVAFLFELIRNLIPIESWFIVSLLGLIITTILSLLILKKSFESAVKYIAGEKEQAKVTKRQE